MTAQGTVYNDYAAGLCEAQTIGGHNDWFLPSKDELNQMYVNLFLNGVGGFYNSTDDYWSSSEDDAGLAWGQNYFNGGQDGSNKINGNLVRCARAF